VTTRRYPRRRRRRGSASYPLRRGPRYQDAKGATPDKASVSNDWFKAIYEVLLGQSQGPRFGSFIELYGVAETRALIDKALKGELVAAA
jgi:lysyl-tRNA synthetase class 1